MNVLNLNAFKSAFTKVVARNILPTRYSSTIINHKMSIRPYDLVVYGASGFTGQYVAAEAFRTRGDKRIAIAGRNKTKLMKVLDFMKEENGGEEVKSKVGLIIANNSNNDTILEMCRQSHVILNCVGPYAYYGEQIVEACIQMGAHHVDISGEPKYIQACQLKYHERAKAQGLHIVSTCGFDSIPADIGLETLRERFPGELVSAESYIHFFGGGKINVGTYNSVIQAVQDGAIVKQQIKDIFKGRLPYVVPKSKKTFGWSGSEKKYFIPFLGPDGGVVNRTQLYESSQYNKTPVSYSPFFTIPNLIVLFFYMLFGLNVFIMTKFQLGIKLLLRYPGFFTFGAVADGVSAEQIKRRGFKIVIHGKGYKTKPVDVKHPGETDTQMSLTLRGPDPGYVFTAITLVAAANTLVEDKLLNNGGVLTPASAFKGTKFVERIEKRGVQITTSP